MQQSVINIHSIMIMKLHFMIDNDVQVRLKRGFAVTRIEN